MRHIEAPREQWPTAKQPGFFTTSRVSTRKNGPALNLAPIQNFKTKNQGISTSKNEKIDPQNTRIIIRQFIWILSRASSKIMRLYTMKIAKQIHETRTTTISSVFLSLKLLANHEKLLRYYRTSSSKKNQKNKMTGAFVVKSKMKTRPGKKAQLAAEWRKILEKRIPKKEKNAPCAKRNLISSNFLKHLKFSTFS